MLQTNPHSHTSLNPSILHLQGLEPQQKFFLDLVGLIVLASSTLILLYTTLKLAGGRNIKYLLPSLLLYTIITIIAGASLANAPIRILLVPEAYIILLLVPFIGQSAIALYLSHKNSEAKRALSRLIDIAEAYGKVGTIQEDFTEILAERDLTYSLGQGLRDIRDTTVSIPVSLERGYKSKMLRRVKRIEKIMKSIDNVVSRTEDFIALKRKVEKTSELKDIEEELEASYSNVEKSCKEAERTAIEVR